MNVVFMGSPEFAVPCLDALLAHHRVIAVVTQPDKPAGRGLGLSPPAVKRRALEAGLPVLQPPSVRKGPFLDELRGLDPDLAVVVAYGKILPPDVLRVPRLGCVNVHASLLPKYRGAAPIQWSIIRGETETGVTLMQMDEGMDTGDMLMRRAVAIDETLTAGELHDKLAPVGAELLVEGLRQIAAGTIKPEKQDPAQATLAPMLTKETGRVDFAAGARAVRDLVRGCDPWPTGWTTLPVEPSGARRERSSAAGPPAMPAGEGGEVLKLFRPRVVSGSGEPGVVLGADRDGLIVGCGPDAVAFAELQLPGRKRMGAQALLAGRAIPPKTKLGS